MWIPSSKYLPVSSSSPFGKFTLCNPSAFLGSRSRATNVFGHQIQKLLQTHVRKFWNFERGSTEVSSWSCADEFFSVLSTMVLGRLSIPEIKLPKDLKGWLILSFTFKIMETSESCQTTVTTIITERRQWVKRFCLFSFFSSLTMSSLLHSSSIMSSLTELSTSVFKVSNAEANSDDSVPSFSDSICWCWRNEFGFQIYTLKKQRQTLEGDEKEWNHH